MGNCLQRGGERREREREREDAIVPYVIIKIQHQSKDGERYVTVLPILGTASVIFGTLKKLEKYVAIF